MVFLGGALTGPYLTLCVNWGWGRSNKFDYDFEIQIVSRDEIRNNKIR